MSFRSFVLFAFLAACGGSEPAAEPAATTPAPEAAAAEKHAPAAVVPGSHEDWCGEHAVPESQCTQCNPELVAAFKATGDWCEEHGLPESQCLKCNPDLKIERPPATH
jgi:zona occludens toxin (predicted ATPase)